MTTTREQLIEMIAGVTQNWEPPMHPEAVISALVHIGIPTDSLVALANGGVVVPVEATEKMLKAAECIVNLGNIDPMHIDDRVVRNGKWDLGSVEDDDIDYGVQGRRTGPMRIYRAMIQAAKDTK